MDPIEALDLAIGAAQHWPITTGQPVLVMQRENIVFKIDTLHGPHALRLHRAGYHSEAVIRSELEWMAMLAGEGFVVPEPAVAGSGSLVVRQKNRDGADRMFSLLSWLPGQPFGASHKPLHHAGRQRTDLMYEIGVKLAHLHLLSDAWQPSPAFQRPSWDRNGLVGSQPFWGRFWDCEKLSKNDREWLSTLRRACSQGLEKYDIEGPDTGLIHADLARENILVNGSNVCFIDFDDGGFGYRMFDLATALIKNIHEPDFATLRDALVQGYLQTRPMKPVDLAALPLMMLLRSLTYLGWVNDRLQEPGMTEKAKRFLADVKYLSEGLSMT